MPVTFTIDHERRRVEGRATGEVIGREMMEYLEARAAAGVLRYDHLLNALGATIRLTVNELNALIARFGQLRGEEPVGFVAIVADDEATYGMGRMAEVLTSFRNLSSQTFRTLGEAEEWLEQERRKTGS